MPKRVMISTAVIASARQAAEDAKTSDDHLCPAKIVASRRDFSGQCGD